MFGSRFFSARYWKARVFGADESPPLPPVASGGGSLWWRESWPRERVSPVDDLPAAADALAKRNAEALILLLI